MEFSPFNPTVKYCMQGIELEEKGNHEEAGSAFFAAWNKAADDFEKYLAAYFIARNRTSVPDRLQWYQQALQLAQKVNDETVKAAFAVLYTNIANCHKYLGDVDNAKRYEALAESCTDEPFDNGPFYHGTRADLQTGDMLTAGYESNYQSALTMNHIYFTALLSGASLAAAMAKGDGHERVYIVEPSGSFENDPNVTNKKFPGNPTRSYRTKAPLKVTSEIIGWEEQMPEELQQWREKVSRSTGQIIN